MPRHPTYSPCTRCEQSTDLRYADGTGQHLCLACLGASSLVTLCGVLKCLNFAFQRDVKGQYHLEPKETVLGHPGLLQVVRAHRDELLALLDMARHRCAPLLAAAGIPLETDWTWAMCTVCNEAVWVWEAGLMAHRQADGTLCPGGTQAVLHEAGTP